MNRRPKAVLTTEDMLRDALDHIARTADQSRSQTRRLRWIAERARLALRGIPYDDTAFDLPPKVDREPTMLRKAIARALAYPEAWDTERVPNEQAALACITGFACGQVVAPYTPIRVRLGEAWQATDIQVHYDPSIHPGELLVGIEGSPQTLLRLTHPINDNEARHD